MILPSGDEEIASGFDKGRARHQAGVWRYDATGTRIAQPTYCSILAAMQLYKNCSGPCVDLAQIGLASWLS
jgi:hypothetical protein